MVTSIVNPWSVAKVHETVRVPIAIVVVPTPRPHKQVRQEINIEIDRERWAVLVVVGQINRSFELDWSKAGTTVFDVVIPVPGNKDTTGWRPDISSWNPDTVLSSRMPVA